MGVRGLTSYIAQNAELYLKPYELHDCDLVIDGDNLACNLYKDVSGCNSAFGGDYDEYYRTVIAFFNLLFECNIRPFVLLDGGYEKKKMRTVEQRLRNKIALVKHLNPSNSKPIFPLMMREVFLDATRVCGVKVMRCIFEADDELAVLSRKLKCPVLSYDSDFYIHNVQYIPLITLTMKVLTRKSTSSDDRNYLRQCQAKNLKKRKKINRGVRLEQEDLEDQSSSISVSSKDSKTIKYLDCCIYKIEYLTHGCKIQKDMLPIFAALLGNDYIEQSVFKQFYSQVCLRGTNKKTTKKQRRIVATLRWLKHETKESALNKIQTRMKKEAREGLLLQIESATCGYNEEKSQAFAYFGLEESDRAKIDEANECKDEEYQENVEKEEKEWEDNEGKNKEKEKEGYESEEDIDEKPDEEVEKNEVTNDESEIDIRTTSDNETDSDVCNEVNEIDNDPTTTKNHFPNWFREQVLSAKLPRFCIDLLHQNLYINNPQIENFLFPDCTEIALPILHTICQLLHYPEKAELRYLTRVVRATNVQYKKLPPIAYNSEFNPATSNLNAIKEEFQHLDAQTDKLFTAVDMLPNHIRLYMLALVYWSSKAQHSDIIHFYSILVCLIVLNTIDSKVIPIRDEKLFYKKYHKIIQKERNLRSLLQETDAKYLEKTKREALKREKIKELLKDLESHERIQFISKAECLLVQENLLKYFKLPQFTRKQHNEFSSSIMHGFSEFQAVVFQLYTLNILVNCPFESPRMGQMYSGTFLYNLYTNLSSRSDVGYYIQNHLLRDSPIMLEFYQFLLSWCNPFVKFLKEPKSKKSCKKLKKKNHKPLEQTKYEKVQKSENTSEHEFDDLNNKFSTLLDLNI